MAEGILKEKLRKNNLNWEVDSAGTASYHIGEPPDPRSVEIARKNGIDISSQTARAFSTNDFDKFDIIYAMDQENYYNILRQARSEKDKQKVSLILDHLYPGEKAGVPDPYYGGKDDFENVYNILDMSCEAVLKLLK